MTSCFGNRFDALEVWSYVQRRNRTLCNALCVQTRGIRLWFNLKLYMQILWWPKSLRRARVADFNEKPCVQGW